MAVPDVSEPQIKQTLRIKSALTLRLLVLAGSDVWEESEREFLTRSWSLLEESEDDIALELLWLTCSCDKDEKYQTRSFLNKKRLWNYQQRI